MKYWSQFLRQPILSESKVGTFPPRGRSTVLHQRSTVPPDPCRMTVPRAKSDGGGSGDRGCHPYSSRAEQTELQFFIKITFLSTPSRTTAHSGFLCGGCVLPRFWSDSSSYLPKCLTHFLAQSSCSMYICSVNEEMNTECLNSCRVQKLRH